jgi:hypothetical protein
MRLSRILELLQTGNDPGGPDPAEYGLLPHKMYTQTQSAYVGTAQWLLRKLIEVRGPKSAPEVEAYHPDATAASILGFLLKKCPVLVKQEDIGVSVSLPTIKDRLAKLEERGLVYRPDGPKGGYQLTPSGKSFAESLPA